MVQRHPQFHTSGMFSLTAGAWVDPGPGPAPTPVPAFTILPSAVPVSATVGDTINLRLGTATDAALLTGILIQDGFDRTSEIVDDIWSPAQAGAFTWTVTATGPGGSTTAPVVSGAVTAAVDPGLPTSVDWSLATIYVDEDTSYDGSEDDVTSLNTGGTASITLPVLGNDFPVLATGDGFVFGKDSTGTSRFFRGSAASLDVTGGGILVAEYTPDRFGTMQVPINIGNNTMTIRISSAGGTIQVVSNNGSPSSSNIGAAAPSRLVVVAEFNAELGRIRYWKTGDGAPTTIDRTMEPFAPISLVGIGQGCTGTLHKAAAILWATGGSPAVSFEDIVADFQAGA